MKNTEKLFSTRKLKKYFPAGNSGFLGGKKRFLRANDGIDLDIFQGETLSLVGESGSGKSTFGRTLLQLYHQTGGETRYYPQGKQEAIVLNNLTQKELRPLRQDMQMIFQDPYSSLNPRMTVGQIIAEGPVTHGFFKAGDPALREYVLQIMDRCGLQAHMYQRYPHQFSGGQRQRISIARALAVKPRFVVCDECVSALDVSVQSQILNLLQELKESDGLTYLFISHDLSVVRHISDRVGVLYLGSLMELGSVEEIFSDPRHPYTVALLSAIPSVEGPLTQRILLRGSIPDPADPPCGCKFHTRCYMAQEKCRREEPPKVEISPGHWAVCHFPERKLPQDPGL